MRLFGGRRSAPAKATKRLFFATDVHGSERCFRKWLNAGRVYEVDALILGGDITGKALVPLCRNGGGTWQGELRGRTVEARDDDEQAALVRRIADSGSYALVTTPEERDALGQDPKALARALLEAMRARIEQWVELADERLAGSGIAAFVMLGNDDDEELAALLRASRSLRYAEDGIEELPGDHEMLSLGYSTPTPWDTPRELSEEELARLIEERARGLDRPHTAVLNLHCPPRDTHLDQAPVLDDELRPVMTAGGLAVGSVGAAAVRGAIEGMGSALGLHGHVHESAAGQRVGETVCINPGSEYDEGILRGAIVELAGDGEVKKWQIVQG